MHHRTRKAAASRREFIAKSAVAGAGIAALGLIGNRVSATDGKTPVKVNSDEIEKRLMAAMDEMDVIDAHEHLGPEVSRVPGKVDVFNLLSHYAVMDLQKAGMSQVESSVFLDKTMPLERRWDVFVPYWKRIRHTSFARAGLIAAKKFYGFDDINEQTYKPLSVAIQAANEAGLFKRVWDICRIRKNLIAWDSFSAQVGDPMMAPVMYYIKLLDAQSPEQLTHPPFEPETTVKNFDGYLESVKRYIIRVKQEGAVGLKICSAPYKEPNHTEAAKTFEALRNGQSATRPADWYGRFSPPNPLQDYLVDYAASIAAEQELVMAVHLGFWGPDFRTEGPLNMIPLVARHPTTRFDLFHLGYPQVRETLMMGKWFPNVWLNFCWCHIISQEMTTAAIEEAIDLLPANKITMFGGDFGPDNVENIYGHLVMAKEDTAKALSRKIVAGRINETEAIELARRWFWQNPIDLYQLKI